MAEKFRVRRRAVLADPQAPAGEAIEAQHVEHAHRGQHDREKIRALLRYRGHEQPAVRDAEDAELRGRRVFSRDEILGDGEEIVEAVLTLLRAGGLIPRVAVFAAAADARAHPRAARLEPRDRVRAIAREQAAREPAVAKEN